MKTGSVQKVTHSELTTSGNTFNGIMDQRSSPLASGLAKQMAGLPSYLVDASDRAVDSAASGEVGKSVQNPDPTEMSSQAAPARGIKEVAVVDVSSVVTRTGQETVPRNDAIPLVVGPTVSPTDNEVAKAVVEAARNLAMQFHFPGVSEAATLVSILVNLVSDDHTSFAEVESRVKRCRLVIMMLQRASMVLGKVRLHGSHHRTIWFPIAGVTDVHTVEYHV